MKGVLKRCLALTLNVKHVFLGFCLFTCCFQQNWLVKLGRGFYKICAALCFLLEVLELSPGLAGPAWPSCHPVLAAFIPAWPSTTPPGPTLQSDRSPMSSPELQLKRNFSEQRLEPWPGIPLLRGSCQDWKPPPPPTPASFLLLL